MKFFISQVAVFLSDRSNVRNIGFVVKFVCAVLFLIALYSTLFHFIMVHEGRGDEFSLITGLYWTLTVMSTLGFGDVTFYSDLGKIFTILVLFSGILCFVIMLPFTIIRFIYQPWLEARSKPKVPSSLPEDTHGHVVLVGTDDIAKNIHFKLKQFSIPCFMISPDQVEAGALYDAGYKVMRGELDMTETYRAARVNKAAMVVALRDDLKNTNIAATVHDLAPDTMLVSGAKNEHSMDILHFAGCKHVFHFTNMLGAAIGRRVFAGRTETNIIGRFDELCIAEVPAASTTLAGKSLLELNLRATMGLNVVGIWQGTKFHSTYPHTIITPESSLLLAGTAEDLSRFDKECIIHSPSEHTSPVLILGGGKVGQKLVEVLKKRKIPFRLVDKNPHVLQEGDVRYILGDAEDISVLRKAGIENVDCMVITTHNDDLNIYLTLYCRKLRPEAQIISRCNLTRNIKMLYDAGANLVMAISSIASNSVVNILCPGSVYMLTEGMNIFRVAMPSSLIGKNLRNSGIRQTQCNVVGMRRNDKMVVSIDPDSPFIEGDELVLIGSTDAEQVFMQKFHPSPTEHIENLQCKLAH